MNETPTSTLQLRYSAPNVATVANLCAHVHTHLRTQNLSVCLWLHRMTIHTSDTHGRNRSNAIAGPSLARTTIDGRRHAKREMIYIYIYIEGE